MYFIYHRDYDKDRTGAMAKATVLYVETIMQQKDLQGKLRKFFNRYFVDIDAAAKRIPGFLQVQKISVSVPMRSQAHLSKFIV